MTPTGRMDQATEAPEADDTGLVRRCAAGDRGAFDLLVARHGGALHRFALRLTGNRLGFFHCISASKRA